MRFHYKAINAKSEVVQGDREAKDKFELVHDLKKDGLIVFFANANQGAYGVKSWQYWNERVVRISLRDKFTFAGNLSAMLSAGLSLSRALKVLLKQTKNVRFHRIIDAITADVDGGSSFHDALAKHPSVFPPVFTSMVEAGEQSGNLPMALTTVGDQLSKSYSLQNKIKGAMVYPVVILCIMAVIGVLMLVYVVPTLTATFSQLGSELPASTKFILGLSTFLSTHLIGIGLALLAALVLLLLWARTSSGRRVIHFSTIHIPVVGSLVRKTNTAVVARTLASLISSGVDMIEALSITERVVQNIYFKHVIGEALHTVQKGEALAAVFQRHEKLFPVMMGEMVEVGEETGKLGEMLMKVAVFYEDEVTQATKDLSTIIEPLLMVLIGSAVGFFAIALVQPIYSIGNSI